MRLIFTMILFLLSKIFFAQTLGLYDETFNFGNTLYLYVPYPDEKFNNLIIQPDNKIVTVGHSQGLYGDGIDYSCTVFRINSDGSMDESFGENGLVLFGDGRGVDVEILPDNKLLVAGNMSGGIGLLRLNQDGSPDVSFGTDGLKIIPLSSFAKSGKISDMMLLDEGSILLTGYIYDGASKQVLVIKLNSDGEIDGEFGNSGYIEMTIESSNDQGDQILVQKDSKILIIGQTATYLFVSRFNPNGSPDTGFGKEGSADYNFRLYQYEGDKFKGALQEDNKLIIAGYMPDPQKTNTSNYAAIRVNSDGTVDNTFGSDGFVNYDFDESNSQDWAHDVLISGGGKILLAGSFHDSNNFANLGILALNPDGSIWEEFGQSGKGVALGNSIMSVEFDNDNNIVAGGLSTQDQGYAVAKFICFENQTDVGKDNMNNHPVKFALTQNYPNPFNPATKINFSISQSEFVSLKVYNIAGEEVAELMNNNLPAGIYSVDFNASELSSGVYLYKLRNSNKSITRKMMLVR